MESALTISSFIAQIFTLLVCFAIPIGGSIIIAKIFKVPIVFSVFGALGFFVLQLCVRIPLLGLFEVQTFLSSLSPAVQGLVLAGSAALFETVGRLITFKIFFRKEKRFGAALLAGLGHGGIEAITIVGLTYINNIVISVVLLASGSVDATVKTLNLSQNYVQILKSFVAMPASGFVMAGLERVFTMIFHILASILLFYFIQKKHAIFGIITTIALHTLLDFTSLMLSFAGASLYTIEFVIFLFALACLGGILLLHKKFKKLEILGVNEDG